MSKIVLRWDGSYLGKYTKEILLTNLNKPPVYWYIQTDTFSTFCIAKRTDDNFPCLCDELKPIFGLTRIGTHSIIIGNNFYVIYKVLIKHGYIIEDCKLSEISPSIPIEELSEFNQRIRFIYTFRELLGILSISENDIILRETRKFKYTPLSNRDAKNSIDKKQSKIKSEILNKWFQDSSISATCKEMFRYTTDEEITELISVYQDKIETVIKRINADYIWYTNTIMQRVYNYLQ
jgi:hypothetical protein